jgi:hypothetical protein
MPNSEAPYLAHRPTFIKVAGWGTGVPFAIALLWLFGSYGGFGWWVFLTAVAGLTAWISAYPMWFIFSAIYLQGPGASRRGHADDDRGA